MTRFIATIIRKPPADIQLAEVNHQAGQKLELAGLLIGKRTLEQFVPKEV